MVKNHIHGMNHRHWMDHSHNINHYHDNIHTHDFSVSVSGSTGDDGSHSHNVYKGSNRATGWYGYGSGTAGQRFDGGASSNDSTYITTDITGSHSHSVSASGSGTTGGASANTGYVKGGPQSDSWATKVMKWWNNAWHYRYGDDGNVAVEAVATTDGAIGWYWHWRDDIQGWWFDDRLNTDGNDGNSIENRPKNYTIRIWRRIR